MFFLFATQQEFAPFQGSQIFQHRVNEDGRNELKVFMQTTITVGSDDAATDFTFCLQTAEGVAPKTEEEINAASDFAAFLKARVSALHYTTGKVPEYSAVRDFWNARVSGRLSDPKAMLKLCHSSQEDPTKKITAFYWVG
ncbi:MAG: hypothetical protein H6850_03195 [Alphaproteobacteria bacterium]|nr:MAG: hypothetical protein H6850_03195 [Alphaproteobacteria bacterium]